MSKAREALMEYADRYGYTEHVNGLIDALVAETRAQALADADQYLTRLGYGDSTYLLRSTDVPVQS